MAARRSARRWRNLQIVIVVDVARRARHVCVPERERKPCRGVIEICRIPALCRVAIGAIGQSKCRTR